MKMAPSSSSSSLEQQQQQQQERPSSSSSFDEIITRTPEAVLQGLVEQHGLETVRLLLEKIKSSSTTPPPTTTSQLSSSSLSTASAGAAIAPTMTITTATKTDLWSAKAAAAASTLTSATNSLVVGIMEASLDAILVVDQDGFLCMTNQEARTLFGLPFFSSSDENNKVEDSTTNNNNLLPSRIIPLSSLMDGDYLKNLQQQQQQQYASSPDSSLKKQRVLLLDQTMQMRDVKGRRYDTGEEIPVQVKVGMVISEAAAAAEPSQEETNNNNCSSNNSNNNNHNDEATFFIVACHDLRHRKEYRHAMERETQLNKAVLDASFEAIVVANDEGKIVHVNPAMLQIFGYATEADIVGKNLDDTIVGGATKGGKHAELHRSYMKNFLQRGGSSTVLGSKRELVARRSDGSEFPCKIGIRKVPGTEFIVGFIQDITHEVQALQEAQLNKSILDSSFEAIVVATSEEGEIVQVNRAMLEIFGYESPDAVLGKNLEILVGQHASMHRQYMKNFQDRQGESRVLGDAKRKLVARRSNGTEFPCKIGIRKVPGSDFVVGFIQDLSQEERAVQAELSAAHNQAEAVREAHLNHSILECSFDAIVVTDMEGTILKVNPAMPRVFGFDSVEQVIGKNIEILVGEEHEAVHRMYMKAFHERGAQFTVLGTKRQLVARKVDGSTFPCRIGVRKVPLGGDNNNINEKELMVGFIQDISHETKALELAVEKHAAEELLFNMLPREIADRLKKDPNHIADHFTKATILFADIVGFTRMSNSLTPFQVVDFLNSIFSRFDEKLDVYGLNKVKTIGDCYMVTSIPGCVDPIQSCAAMCHFSMDMIQILEHYNQEHPDAQLHMRIGVNTGPVVAGVVGTKRFLYDIWGDAVNVASRMESTGLPGKVQITQAVRDALMTTTTTTTAKTTTTNHDYCNGDEFTFEKRGFVQVKGIGEMETYFIARRDKIQAKRYWRKIRSSVRSSPSSTGGSGGGAIRGTTTTATTTTKSTEPLLELLQSAEQLDNNNDNSSNNNKAETTCVMAASRVKEEEDGGGGGVGTTRISNNSLDKQGDERGN